MCSVQDLDMEVEEKRIERIIGCIQKKRNRAGYQSILSFAKRENKGLEMDTLKTVIKNMTEKSVIYNKNKDDPEKESFKLFQNFEKNGEASTQTFLEESIADEDEDLENYINKSFEETLINMVKKEVNVYITDNLMETLANIIKVEVTNATMQKFEECGAVPETRENSILNECKNCDNNLLYTSTLNDHITFLQKELEEKDTIIKMLISDRNNVTSSNEQKSNVQSTRSKNPFASDMLEEVNVIRDVKISADSNKTESGADESLNQRSCTSAMLPGNRENDQGSFDKVVTNKKHNQRSIAILGDSIIKDVDPFELKNKLKNKKDRVYRHTFNGATIRAMKHHAVPVMEFNPDLAILHVGTNSLRGNTSEQQIAQDIVDLAVNIKTDENNILVSSIIARRDNLKEKAEKVNDFLRIKCAQLKLPFLRHNNIRSEIHLKPKGQHLNAAGSTLLSDNFAVYINS